MINNIKKKKLNFFQIHQTRIHITQMHNNNVIKKYSNKYVAAYKAAIEFDRFF